MELFVTLQVMQLHPDKFRRAVGPIRRLHTPQSASILCYLLPLLQFYMLPSFRSAWRLKIKHQVIQLALVKIRSPAKLDPWNGRIQQAYILAWPHQCWKSLIVKFWSMHLNINQNTAVAEQTAATVWNWPPVISPQILTRLPEYDPFWHCVCTSFDNQLVVSYHSCVAVWFSHVQFVRYTDGGYLLRFFLLDHAKWYVETRNTGCSLAADTLTSIWRETNNPSLLLISFVLPQNATHGYTVHNQLHNEANLRFIGNSFYPQNPRVEANRRTQYIRFSQLVVAFSGLFFDHSSCSFPQAEGQARSDAGSSNMCPHLLL